MMQFSFVKSAYFVIVFLLINFSSKAQDYKDYYRYIDSAEYFIRDNNIKKVNEYYCSAFNLNRGFPNDYTNAIIYSYKEKNALDYKLVEKGFSDGLDYKNLVSSLKLNNVIYSKKELKKSHRKFKLRKEVGSSRIILMLIPDQIHRRLISKKMSKGDSITSVKLIELLKKKPEYFNRFKTGNLGSELIGILMIHSGWNNLESIQNSIHDLTKRGIINRNVLASIIERSAIVNGAVFEFDSLRNKIVCYDNQKMILCTSYFPNIGWFYGEKTDHIKKVIYLPPLHPNLSLEKINELRRYLFLSDLSLKYNSKGNILTTKEEYCKFR